MLCLSGFELYCRWVPLVTVNNNSPIQDYVHPDDQTQPTFEMTPGFKPFTVRVYLWWSLFCEIQIKLKLIKGNLNILTSG